MSVSRSWSTGAKLLTISVVGFLLTFGLCSVGTPFEGHGNKAQDLATEAGVITFFLSVLLLVIGFMALVVRALHK